MNNFTYYNPTRLIFGRGVENAVGEEIHRILGKCARVALVYGGGSIKRTGLYDRVKASLASAGMSVLEIPGVPVNPTLEFVREGLEKVRETPVDAVLAVGGGSVMDAAKAIAVGVRYDGDVWDFYEGVAEPADGLPIFCIPTQPATGSEQSIRTVITNGPTKTGMGNEWCRSKAALINPELYMTLPVDQIGAAIVDMMSHIMERYFSPTTATSFVDWQAEAALRCAMRYGPKVIENPQDYDAWCQVSMVGTFAHNGYYGLGRVEDWASHAIEHELSGWHPEITHGKGLAVVIPAWMKHVSERRPERFVRFAVRVMGVEPQASDKETIALGIAKLCGFFLSIGMPLNLAELGAADCPVEELARHCCRKGPVGHLMELDVADVVAILTSAAG